MVARIEVEPGTVYGQLTVVKEVYSPRKRKFLCKCDCKAMVEVRLDHLRTGHSQSCGKCGEKYRGERKPVAQWAKLYGIKESTLRARLSKMSLADAIAMGPANQ